MPRCFEEQRRRRGQIFILGIHRENDSARAMSKGLGLDLHLTPNTAALALGNPGTHNMIPQGAA